jgi:hypothetical protein
MDVDEALEVADNPHHYTHLDQATSRYTLAAEVRRLRARDEAAAAVVEWWQANRHREAAVEYAARVQLDALARAHGRDVR